MSPANDTVTPIIGLEIHVELATATKMFCRCRNRFGDPPNTHTCPVCIGLPGALPVMNAQAVEYSMKVGLALGCTVREFSKWDRKGYYYPDLPKNYQISQYDLPLCENGHLEIPVGDGEMKSVAVLRAHLEEDAGKNVHDNPAHTGVDLNRAGVPLLEIVSQPEMNSAEQALAYARTMHRLVRWLGVSEANMQMGHMRFEPNINLHIQCDGRLYKTPIIEVKNLNSFRALAAACRYEIERQYDEFRADREGFSLARRGKQNRGYDDATGRTVHQRRKEEAEDYRYFPEPDLVPVATEPAALEALQASLGELPLARRERFIGEYALSAAEADQLTHAPADGDLLDAAVAAGAPPKRVTNLLLGRAAALANERETSIGQLGLTGEQLAELARMLEAGEINSSAGDRVLGKLVAGDSRSPREIADSEGLLAVSDAGQIAEWGDQAIAANPQAVADVQAGGKKQKKAFGFLTGQVMQLSRGAAQPQEVQRLLQEKIDAGENS